VRVDRIGQQSPIATASPQEADPASVIRCAGGGLTQAWTTAGVAEQMVAAPSSVRRPAAFGRAATTSVAP